MNSDLVLVVGLLVGALSFPAAISAFSDRRPPLGAFLALMIGAGLVYYANQLRPNGYTLEDVPMAFVEVVAMIIN